MEPHTDVPDLLRRTAADRLQAAGWDGRAPLAALAPGAAYGGAKKWPAAYFAELAAGLIDDGVVCVLVGSAADAAAGLEVLERLRVRLKPPLDFARGGVSDSRTPNTTFIDLIGQTDLPLLAGVLANCRALVSNDSGAMHLGAAIGVPVTAPFGPTNEDATRPLGDRHAVLTHPVWCRPCMLRECPLDHRCMRGIRPERVLAVARRSLTS
jgi:heptosyltransferase-2